MIRNSYRQKPNTAAICGARRRSFSVRLFAVTLAIATFMVSASAQSTPQNNPHAVHRPRIGLVLEGGGALGLAHIGVIQWLEEHHIPVRYVSGTSMGAPIGGVYATGHSPDEIREVISGIKWDEVLRGATPYQDLSFRRKEDAQDYPNSLEFASSENLMLSSRLPRDGAAGIVVNTIFGPELIAGSVGDADHHRIFFRIGRLF